jgi:hypothetical protein
MEANRKTYFTGLPAGTYVFKVKAASSRGAWSKQETKLTIEILPPWWASVWAYAIYSLLGALVIYYAIRNYHNRVEEKTAGRLKCWRVQRRKRFSRQRLNSSPMLPTK